MLHHVKTAMELTTSHGLPRVVTNKPLYIRISWLLLFLLMLAVFLKGFGEFVVKLQSRQVTSTLEANSLNFQFPDIYVCFENPISGSYSANIDAKSADAINAQINATRIFYRQLIAGPSVVINDTVLAQIALNETHYSFAYPQTLQYTLLADILAHRKEQNVIASNVAYQAETGLVNFVQIDPEIFYHPIFLRCLKWKLNSTHQSSVVQPGSSSGIVLTLNADTNFSGIPTSGGTIQPVVYARSTVLPVSDWSLSYTNYKGTDRLSGVRVFITSPGEYPSDFATSFSLSPGKHHTVEIRMMQHMYKNGQFPCLSDAPDVQFVNPYDQTPYNHTYSYSYCYYYMHHKQIQALINISGVTSPLPWPLRGPKFILNLTGEPTLFSYLRDPSLQAKAKLLEINTRKTCESQRPCSTLDYAVSISSADWPTLSTLGSFVGSSIKEAQIAAQAKNLSVPALDFLLSANSSVATSYVRNNLLKVHFKPQTVLSDRLSFSIDYGVSNFISDIGGIMGIYLGMSLLTLVELIELFYDLIFMRIKGARSISEARVSPGELEEKA